MPVLQIHTCTAVHAVACNLSGCTTVCQLAFVSVIHVVRYFAAVEKTMLLVVMQIPISLPVPGILDQITVRQSCDYFPQPFGQNHLMSAFCAGAANAGRSVSLLTELPQAPASATARSTPSPLVPPPGASALAVAPFTASAAAPDAKPVQVKSEAQAVTPPPASHADTDMGVKAEEEQQQQTGAAPSLITAVTQTGINPNAPPQLPSAQSMLEDGHVFMPQMPADLQAELASSASSSFNGIATFGIMQQQLSSTFDGSPGLAGDFAADLFSSPAFAVTDVVDDDSNGGVADAAVASNVGAGSPIINIAAFNAAAGVFSSHKVHQQQHHACMQHFSPTS